MEKNEKNDFLARPVEMHSVQNRIPPLEKNMVVCTAIIHDGINYK